MSKPRLVFSAIAATVLFASAGVAQTPPTLSTPSLTNAQIEAKRQANAKAMEAERKRFEAELKAKKAEDTKQTTK